MLYDQAIPLLGIYLNKAVIQKDTYTPMFTKQRHGGTIHNCKDMEALFTITKTWRQPERTSADEWIRKMLYIYTGILLSHKKEWNNAICGNMDEPRDYHTKWSKSKRERQCVISYKSNLNHDTNEPIYRTNRITDKKNRLVVDKWVGIHWEFGVSKSKLLYREQINKKVLLYSTGNYIQYPVINHNGKRYKKEYTYVQLNHFTEQQKLT